MNKSEHRVKGLGEFSIRVKDLDAMQKFYEEVVGLEVAPHRGLCSGGTRVLYSSKSQKVMADIHRISHSLKHLTQCFFMTRLNS